MMEDPPAMDMMMEDAMSKKSSKKSSEKPKSDKPMSEKMEDDEKTPMMGDMAMALGGAAGDALGLNAFGGSDGSDNTKFREPVRTDCCCCLCGCSNELTEGVKCCFCLPIKSGIVVIGGIVLLLALN